MKPRDLKSPFTWANRQVVVADSVWYIPDFCSDYDSFQFLGWDHPTIFKKKAAVKIEYCSGNGDWIISKALAHPDINWVAVEMQFERVRKIWSKMKNLQIDNLLIICGEGLLATKLYFPENSVDEFFINFPDPWPKNRHSKNRIMSPLFCKEMERVLVDGGKITLVTDDQDYSKMSIQILLQNKRLESCFKEPFYINDWTSYGSSFFEQLWRSQKKEIYYHQFMKLRNLVVLNM